MKLFENKTVIITGGGKAKSIGYGIATSFAKNGANIVITGRNEKKLIDAKNELENLYNINVLPIVADVSKNNNINDTVKNVIDKTIEKFGKIDVLINNAQASKSGTPLSEHEVEDFDLAIYSGLYSTFLYMKHSYPFLKETKGTVINFASGAGISGNAGQASYAAAKEGIRGLSRVAATEWGRDNINVNVVCPLALTDQLEKFKEEFPETYEKNIKSIPMGKFGDPEYDIGNAVVMLCTENFKYMSGQTISLQGGSGLRP